MRAAPKIDPMNDTPTAAPPSLDPIAAISRLLSSGKTGEAIDASLALLGAHADVADALHTLALGYGRTGELQDALALLKVVVRLQPNNDIACANLGRLLNQLGRHADAATVCGAALRLNPANGAAWANMGVAHYRRQQFVEALPLFQRALALAPDHQSSYGNLANTLFALDQVGQAQAVYEDGLARFPDDAELSYCYATCLLTQGHYREGWRWYESRYRYRREAGTALATSGLGPDALAGKSVLLRAEQGLGDVIQMSRYIPQVAAHAAHVTVEAPAPLVELLRSNFGSMATIIVQQAGASLPAADLSCSLMSLPLLLQTELETIPTPGRYLEADGQRRAAWAAVLPASTQPRVGFVWKGNENNPFWGDRRSIPLDAIATLIRSAGMTPVVLQHEMNEREHQVLHDVARIGPRCRDLADTAAVIEQLDLVLTIDTSVAHLAGALGKPVWVMLPSVPDWRWMRARSDCPWYASMRLFRQARSGQWDGVLAQVQAELAAWLDARRAPLGAN